MRHTLKTVATKWIEKGKKWSISNVIALARIVQEDMPREN